MTTRLTVWLVFSCFPLVVGNIAITPGTIHTPGTAQRISFPQPPPGKFSFVEKASGPSVAVRLIDGVATAHADQGAIATAALAANPPAVADPSAKRREAAEEGQTREKPDESESSVGTAGDDNRAEGLESDADNVADADTDDVDGVNEAPAGGGSGNRGGTSSALSMSSTTTGPRTTPGGAGDGTPMWLPLEGGGGTSTEEGGQSPQLLASSSSTPPPRETTQSTPSPEDSEKNNALDTESNVEDDAGATADTNSEWGGGGGGEEEEEEEEEGDGYKYNDESAPSWGGDGDYTPEREKQDENAIAILSVIFLALIVMICYLNYKGV